MVDLYKDRISAEKNELLGDFYNRIIVHQILKIQFIREVFNIYKAQGNKENLILLTRKLLKLSKINEPKSDKISKVQSK
jgi:predicted thioredoxin/glutaredoxin